jgi:hypothetical protein
MSQDLHRIERSLLEPIGLTITSLQKDKECEDYSGYNLKLGQRSIKFRSAKITPKKIGQFVTLWERSADGQTRPFSNKTNTDFYIVATRRGRQFGFFIFPAQVLADQRILSSGNQRGKRGFRIYTPWDSPQNTQAQITQFWQREYFIDLTDDRNDSFGRFNSIFDQ